MKKPLKVTLKIVFSLLTLLVIIYFLGPKPPKPNFTKRHFDNAISLGALEQSIVESEKREPNIKQGNEAKAESHVITSDLTTDTWQAVEAESVKFIKEILGM